MVDAVSELQLHAVSRDTPVVLPVPGSAADVHDLFAAIVDAPPGIYSALRTYHGNRFLDLDAHLARCQHCVERASFPRVFDYGGLAVAIDRVVSARSAGDARLRFDLLQRPIEIAGTTTQILLGVAPHHPVPSGVLSQGAHLELAPPGLARAKPLIKFTDWVIKRQICQEPEKPCFEYLLQDAEHRILEGISSNFFAVKGQSVLTAREGVLEGITRQVVCELARKRGLEVRWGAVPLDALAHCDEAFITSSTREIVPVTRVGELVIGPGTPGPVVGALREDYAAHVAHSARRAH